MKYNLIIILTFSFCVSCSSQSEIKTEKIIELNSSQMDTVIFFKKGNTDSFKIYREIEIIENNFHDTLQLGYSLIPPKYTGVLYFTQIDLDDSHAIYLDRKKLLDFDDASSFSKLFTLKFWAKKRNDIDKGKIKIKLLIK